MIHTIRIRNRTGNYFAVPGLISDVIIASQIFKAPIELMYSKSRKKEAVFARYAVMYKRMLVNGHSTTEAALEFDRDHCAALHAKKNIINLVETDKDFKESFKTYLKNFTNEDTF